MDRGIGVVLKPHNGNSRVTIANLGQRQAILHDVSTRLGVYRDEGEPSLRPMAKLSMKTGELAVLVLPRERDPQQAVQAIESVPLLESAVRLPTKANRKKEGASNG